MNVFLNGCYKKLSDIKLFPNYKALESLCRDSGGTTIVAETVFRDERKALFSEFGGLFEDFWRNLLGVKLSKVRFGAFGVCSFSNLIDRLTHEAHDFEPEYLILQSEDSKISFGILAPSPTFQALYDATLGFELTKLYKEKTCRSGRLFRERLTDWERSILSKELICFGDLFPLTYRKQGSLLVRDDDWALRWQVEFSSNKDFQFCKQTGSYYWERRSFELSGQVFYWYIIIPSNALHKEIGESRRTDSDVIGIKKRSGLIVSDKLEGKGSDACQIIPIPLSTLEDGSSETASLNSTRPQAPPSPPDEAVRTGNDKIQRNTVVGTLDTLDSLRRPTLEMIVDIGESDVDQETWNALRPGSVLTTNIDSQALFAARLEDGSEYSVKPGIFRNLPAVQIKRRIR